MARCQTAWPLSRWLSGSQASRVLSASQNPNPARKQPIIQRSQRREVALGATLGRSSTTNQISTCTEKTGMPLRGTSSFKWYSVVLDVPVDAERITFGVLLHGPGAVFIRELVFDEVDVDVSSTDLIGPLRAASPAGGSSGGSL